MKTKRVIFAVILIAIIGLFIWGINSDESNPGSDQDSNTPQAKIDPEVACQNALIYMTFTSGEEADAFVEACKNGEHPEVIERYISDMGLDGAKM